MTRILLVDDEPAILESVAYSLRGAGWEIDTRADGESALAAGQTHPYDVVILDVLLPGISGTEVCRRLREQSDVPILMLTARGSEVERVVGLEAGADDYVTKPFSTAELISRVRAILRRRQLDRAGGMAVKTVGGLRVDLLRHEAYADEQPVRLTPMEFSLLAMLASEPERVFSRREIMHHLWDSEHVGDGRACDIHISNLRAKIEADPARPERIITVRGAGYKLVPA